MSTALGERFVKIRNSGLIFRENLWLAAAQIEKPAQKFLLPHPTKVSIIYTKDLLDVLVNTKTAMFMI